MKKLITFWIIFFGLIILVNSCGAKKRESSKKEEILKTDYSGFFRNSGNSSEFQQSDLNLQISTLTKVDDQNQKVTTKKIIKPIDSNTPASYIDSEGKKHQLNNTEITEETIVEKNNKKSENSQNSQEILKSISEKDENFKYDQNIVINAENKKVDEAIKSDKKQWQLPWFFWLIIAVIILFVFRYLNKQFHWIKYVTEFIPKLFQIRKK